MEEPEFGQTSRRVDRTRSTWSSPPCPRAAAWTSEAPVPLVRVRALEHLPEILERMNLRFEDLLRDVGLPEVALDNESNFFPLREALAIIEAAARASGIAHLGLVLANVSGFDALGSYGQYIKGAPTLLQAIRRADEYLSWHTIGAGLSLRAEGSAVAWRYELSRAIRADRQHAYLFALVLMRNVVRLAAGPDWMPDELRLEQPPANSCHALHQAFGDRITWDHGENALIFPAALLPRILGPVPQPRRENGSSAETLAATTPAAEFVSTLNQLILSFLPSGNPSAELLAHISGLPLRSFQRHLAQFGVSFTSLVDDARLRLAIQLMRDPANHLTDVALELGYSDPANFTRAFRRWTGLSPRRFRQGLVQI